MLHEPKLPPQDPEPEDPWDPIPSPNPDEPGPDMPPRIDPPPTPLPERLRVPNAFVSAAMILGTALLYAQAPSKEPADPHEDPTVQNAPEVKKVDPQKAGAGPKVAIPPIKAATKPKATVKARVVSALDPQEVMLGTWVLVKEKSSYQPGPAPRSETRTYRKTPAGIEATIVTTQDDGTVQTTTFPWMADGNEHPVRGSKVLDSIRLKQIDNLTSEASLRHGTKELAMARRAIDATGKTMTITVTDMTSEDRPVTVRAVYEKR